MAAANWSSAEEEEPRPVLPPKTRRATAVDRLYRMGRELVGVPINNNSLFESVARQIDDSTYSAMYIRTHAAYQGLGNIQKYIKRKELTPKDIVQWRVEVSKFREDMFWNRKKAYLMLCLISDSLNRKIVVVRDEEQDIRVFGKDGTSITSSTIVVVEISRSKPEYHATRMREGVFLPEMAASDQQSYDEEEEDDYEYVLQAEDEWDNFSFTRTHSVVSSRSSEADEYPLVAFQASKFYGTDEEQLKEIGREIDCLEPFANSFFESIARQAAHRNITPNYLRNRVILIGRKRTDWFYKFISHSPDDFLNKLTQLENEHVWFPEMWFMVMVMLTRILKLEKIVVIKSFCKPVMCPNDGQPITNRTIVIVQNDHNNRYHATKVTTGKGKQRQQPRAQPSPALSGAEAQCPRLALDAKTIHRRKNSLRINLESSAPQEDTDAQLMLIGREEVIVPFSGNSQFIAVSEQAQDPSLNPTHLRLLTYRAGIRCPQTFAKYANNREDILLSEMRNIRERGYWNPEMADLVFNILAVAIKRDIVILRNNKSPLFYPADAVLDDDTIVLIQVNITPINFNSTKKSTLREMLQEGEQPASPPVVVLPGPSRPVRTLHPKGAAAHSQHTEDPFATSGMKEALMAPFKKGYTRIRDKAQKLKRSKVMQRLRPRPTPDPLPAMNTPPDSDDDVGGGDYSEIAEQSYEESVRERYARRPLPPIPSQAVEEGYGESVRERYARRPLPPTPSPAVEDYMAPMRRSRSIEHLPPAPPQPLNPAEVEEEYMEPASRTGRSSSEGFLRGRVRASLPRRWRHQERKFKQTDV